MRTRTFVTVGAVVLLAGVVAVHVQAQPPFAGRGAGHGAPFAGGPHANSPIAKMIQGRIGRMLVLRSELDITHEQRRKIFAKVSQHKTELISAVQKVHEAKGKLKAAVLAESAQESAIRDAAAEVGKSIGDAAVVVARVQEDVRPILTDEQIAKLRAFGQDNQEALDSFFTKLLED